MQHPPIQYLQRRELDEARWNECISLAENGLLYAYSFYLDKIADHWNGLILGNYEAVMSLPWRKKGGFYYLYHAFFIPQAGVFGNHLTAEILLGFLQAIPEKFRYWDFSLNYKNRFPVSGFPLHQRMNYVLPLQKSYDELYKSYRESTKRNIRKCLSFHCRVKKGIPPEAVFALTKYQPYAITQKEQNAFTAVFSYLKEKSQAESYGIVSASGELLSAAVFLFSHRRAYYILVGNHPNGRTLGASHALIDSFIRDYCGKDLILDFEGSDIRNLAFFYSSFGAVEEKYWMMKWNRLPFGLKWLKK